ncbi:MAG: AAA family ATPase [Clostridia bacterium]|nr:AAA family ATPase [Clostridia bacterium]
MPNEFTVSMSVENIGPHFGPRTLTYSGTVQSNKTIIFSTNGTGKSFVSRAFRLCTIPNRNETADDVLSIGEDEGHFRFGIHNNAIDKKLELTIKRGSFPVVSNSTGFLFHVFNSDYVEENIRPKHYSPDGNITGYILGKVQIDLTEEKAKEIALTSEVDTDSKAIDKIIETAKMFLRQYGVTSNTTEYQAITRTKVEQGFGYEQSGSVEEYIENLNKLATVPDNLADIAFSLPQQDLSFFDALKSVLLQAYPESKWDEEFVKYYKEHLAFIEAGLAFSDADKTCPFCKRDYDANALSLIHQYNQYRNDQEAKIINKLKNLMSLVIQIMNAIDREDTKNTAVEVQLLKIQQYFPSLSTSAIEKLVKFDEYKQAFQALIDTITAKTENLCMPIDNAEGIIEDCISAWKEILCIQTRNRETIELVNKTKNNVNTERLQLRRQLCKAKSIALQDGLFPKMKALSDKKAILKKLHDTIVEKEEQAKISKRHKVYETLRGCLNRFFSGKYDIDEDTFQIRFLGTNIGDKASRILSDGEKNIVAFCWYLAETHTVVNSEDDYNKLFFVIDDPISSMDFHYVYAVAQTIRDLKRIFGFSGNERVWVLTHNLEFFSIIMRNYILSNALTMKPGSITPFKHELLMPYESHLNDLIEIVDGTQHPNHTTGNSIRHVIETISRFENPEMGLDTFIRNNEMLSKDACIYTLCQDTSHGYVRYESPYSEDVLYEAAKTVINFIETKYPGQIKAKRA